MSRNLDYFVVFFKLFICVDISKTDSGDIKIFPVSQAVTTESLAYIQCYSKSKASWKKNGESVKSERINFNNFLRIKKVKVKDAGNWTCYGKGPNNVNFEATSELLVGG